MLSVSYILIKRETNQKNDVVELYEEYVVVQKKGMVSSFEKVEQCLCWVLKNACIWRFEIHRVFQQEEKHSKDMERCERGGGNANILEHKWGLSDS